MTLLERRARRRANREHINALERLRRARSLERKRAYQREWGRRTRAARAALRQCRDCGGVVPRPRSGPAFYCLRCRLIREKESRASAVKRYRRKHPDRVRAQKRAWAHKNPERARAGQAARYRRYVENNPARALALALARSRKWRSKNLVLARAYQRASQRVRRLKNPDRFRAAARVRRLKNLARIRAQERVRAPKRRATEQYRAWHRRFRFEQSIKGMPPKVQEMRRTLVEFKRWLRANGYTQTQLLKDA